MEDIDPPREVPGSARDILATLAAFGLESDEPILRQSERTAAYQSAFEQLRRLDRVFACWCSRSDLEATGGVHRGACIAAPDESRQPAWRVRAAPLTIEFDDAIAGRQVHDLANDGDFVVRRVEGWYAYQLAVVVDDAFQSMTDIVRGADLLDSTPRQIYLQQLLGLATPRYVHLPLVRDAEGRKLSKQDRARPVDLADPMPALRAALAFLGMAEAARGACANPAALLHTASRVFDLDQVRAYTVAHAAAR